MEENSLIKKKKRHMTIIIVATILIFLGCVLAGLIFYNSVAKPQKKVKKQLDLGEKYLSDLEYENAILSYREAIAIDPKCEKAYIGLGDAYIGLAEKKVEDGDIEGAVSSLKKGIRELKSGVANTSSEEVSEKLDELREMKKELEENDKDTVANSEELSETPVEEPEDLMEEKLKEAKQAYYDFLSADPTSFRVNYEFYNVNTYESETVELKSIVFTDIWG